MALALGEPAGINQKECTVTAPLDCDIPVDYLTRVPVANSPLAKPSVFTPRLLRFEISKRLGELRELEGEGKVPRNPEKVRELHQFAVNFRENMPAFFRASNPDMTWDKECYYVPVQREMLSYLLDTFLMALHRPYIFTREKSQRQVYDSSLAILDSQHRLFETARDSHFTFQVAVTFPTFDAAVLLGMVLVSNPERYQTTFQRLYLSLTRALEHLEFIGVKFRLARTCAEVIRTTIRRIVEAQEHVGFPPALGSVSASEVSLQATPEDEEEARRESMSTLSASLSPDSSSQWQFEAGQSVMDWTTQNPEFSEFDFSNLEVPHPLKELLLEEESTSNFWAPTQELHGVRQVDEQMVYVADNSLWNFLAGYPSMDEEQNMQL
jgi:hypothetical protein